MEYVKYLNDTNSDLTNVLVELDENGTVKCAYTLGADLISQEIDGKTYTYLYDGHGSVTALSDESGSVTDTYTYDAFGNLLKSTGRTANNYLYCGEQFDGTTGLYYLRARYMDTSTGRFISQDAYQGDTNDPVSLHKYLYANSNPVMYTDPSGYFTDGSSALEIDEYLVKRLSIEVIRTEVMYYSRDAKGISDHITVVIATGLLILGAITCIVGVTAAVMCYYETKAAEIANGEQDSLEQNKQRKNNKVNDALNTTEYGNRLNPNSYTYLDDDEKIIKFIKQPM